MAKKTQKGAKGNTANETSAVGATSTTSSHSVSGVVIGVLIVFLVLILGGLFLWSSYMSNDQVAPTTTPVREIPNNERETPRAEADIQVLETTSSSDELGDIEADLESTLLELDGELNTIEAELDGDIEVQ